MTPPGPTDPADDARRPRAGAASGVAAILLAGGAGTRLLDLCEREARPALHVGGRRRLIDYALQEVARAGLAGAAVVVQHHPDTLRAHLPQAWGGRLALDLRDGGGRLQGEADAVALGLDGEAAGTVVVLSTGRAGAFDLPALLAAHRAGGAPATVLALAPAAASAPGLRLSVSADGAARPDPAGGGEAGGALVLDAAWARARLDEGPDLDALLARAAAEGGLRAHPQPDAVWRDAATPDALRRAALEMAAPLPFPLPPETGLPDDRTGDRPGRPDLVMEAGGLTLTVPRFGARRGGRWTLLEDSVVMPGARVAPGARLSRALVAPGAIVPAGLVVGEDAEEDARWFRACAGPEGEPPTILVTAPMLARRAAERMRLSAGLPALTPQDSR